MIKTVKVDKFNYFAKDKDSKIRIQKYDPKEYPNLVFLTRLEDHSLLIVPADKINQRCGGQISFEYGNDKYFIDDGYRDNLVRAGYIVLNDYDLVENHINDINLGINIRDKIKEVAVRSLEKLEENELFFFNDFQEQPSEIHATFMNQEKTLWYTVYINTVNSIVNKNQQRKANQLPFYPFDKKMDKYGTFYISIFCERISEKPIDSKSKYENATEFIAKLIEQMNRSAANSDQYRFSILPIKRKLINWKGI